MRKEFNYVWHTYRTVIVASVITILLLGLYALVYDYSNETRDRTAAYQAEMSLLSCKHALANKATPTEAITEIPTPTPTAQKPLLGKVDSLSNKLIFINDKNLLVSDLDGGNAVVVVDGVNNLGYAGRAGNDTIYFYTSVTTSTIGVFKKNVASGDMSLLFTFNEYRDGFEKVKVQLSPNNRYFMYSNGDLQLYDIQSGTNRILLKSMECIPPNIKPDACYAYGHGTWSPDGNYALVFKVFWEGGGYFVVNPFEDRVQERHFKSVQGPIDYDSTRMTIAVGTNYGYNTVHLYTLEDQPRDADLLSDSQLFKMIYPNSAVTSSTGDIAFVDSGKKLIGLYNINDHSSKVLKKVSNANYYVQGWLPDNKTLLYSDDKHYIWSLDTSTMAEAQLHIQANKIYEATP